MEFKQSPLGSFGVLIRPISNKADIRSLNTTDLKKLFLQEQLIVLRGFTTFSDAEDFSEYCKDWGEISIWPFGKVLELVELENPKDHIFHHSYIPLHWDGMYRPQVPEYQIFHCVRAPIHNQGGRTTFSNTILALKNAAPEVKEIWSKVIGSYERKMEFYNSKTISPIITKHPFRDFSVIRYNEPHQDENGKFINPPKQKFHGIDEHQINLFHQGLKKSLYDPKNFYAHEWQEGDVIIADNFSLLHGREEFISKAPRHLQRVQVLSDPPLQNPHLESYK